MKLLNISFIAILLLITNIGNAQIKNPIINTVEISGNCGMCKNTIEKAGNLKNIASVDWNKDTNLATITYNEKKTNPSEILKRIALAGYDNGSFLAPDDAYSSLSGCCQYDRTIKQDAMQPESIASLTMDTEHDGHSKNVLIKDNMPQDPQQLKTVFDKYFEVKDALVKSDDQMTSIKATELLNAINEVKMEKLSMDEHMVWMKVLENLKSQVLNMASSQNIDNQRKAFISLSEDMYSLAKSVKVDSPIYYQHCPMANGGKGANWLSKENQVKNPYYGSTMLTCGKTVETIN